MKNYFKKFSIMFVMALAIIGVGMIQNGTIANAATVGDKLVQPETGWTRYEDTDKNISYAGGWLLWNGSSNIWTNSTVYYSANINSVCKFNFTGDKIRIITELDSDHTTNVNVKIDGISLGTFSERNSVQKGKTAVYEKTGLSKGEHSIELINLDNYHFNIDAIDLDENGILKSYNENIKSITLDHSSMDLKEGDSGQLIATTTPSEVGVKWTTSDPSIATIEVDPSNGKIIKVNTRKEGTCIITATTTDGNNLSASCTINVTKKDVIKPDTPTTDTKIGAILIINLIDGETKVYDVSIGEVAKFKFWYNTKTEYENKLTYEFDKTVNSSISVEENVVHDKITSYEIRKY